MFAGTSFRSRLLVSFAAVILLALALPALSLRHLLRVELLEDASAGAMRQLELVQAAAREHGAFAGPDEFQAWVGELGSDLGLRVTYIGEHGRVLADSEVPAAEVAGLENHADRPEIVAAGRDGRGTAVRFSATLEADLVYAAMKASGIEGLPPGYLRLAVPFAGVRGRLEALGGSLALVVAATLALAGILALLLSRHLSRSVRSFADMVEAIAAGDLGRRIRHFPGSEFAPLAGAVNSMAARVQDTLGTVTEQKGQLEAVLDGMREGLLVLDPGGRIIQSNPAMARIFPGLGRAAGRRPLEVIASPELQQACERVLAGKAEASEGLRIEPERGRAYDVNVVRSRRPGGDPDGIGAILVFHDVSELLRLERVRRDFVANVSHELRTPLTTIKGWAEALLENPQAAPRLEGVLQAILRNADHMARMVEDLLSLSRLESGRVEFLIEALEPAGPLDEALRACSGLAERRRITFARELPPGGPVVLADPVRLAQVFRNLVENACTFSPEGGLVRVRGEVRGDLAEFAVTDEGPGVPREEQAKIFERFYRVDKHRNKESGSGSGLGLSIARHIVERLGGTIRVESPLGDTGGAAFCFTLPLATEAGGPGTPPITPTHTQDPETPPTPTDKQEPAA